jgi:hypothetical protein
VARAAAAHKMAGVEEDEDEQADPAMVVFADAAADAAC